MAIFAGNLRFKFSTHLQSRVLLLTPWVQKSSVIRCCGDYSTTSGPVRYIPKKFSKLEEFEEKELGRRNSGNLESGNCSDSFPLRNGVSEKRSNFGKRSQNGVSYKSKAENVESSNVYGTGKMPPCQNLENAESDSIPLRNEVAEKRSDVGKRTQNGVVYNSKAENVESSNVFGTGIQKMHPGQNLGNAESDNYSDSILLSNGVSEKRWNFAKRTQNDVSYNSKPENVESSNMFGTGIQKMQPGQNSRNAESDNYSDLIPLRNGVSEKRSDVGKRTLNGISYNSKAENVESSNALGTGIQKRQPGQNSQNAKSDNYSDSIPLRNEVLEERSNFGTRTQNGVIFNTKAENVESSNTFGIGIQKMQPGQNSQNAESDNYSDLISLRNGVSEKSSDVGKRTLNEVSYNSKGENVESSNMSGIGIQKMQPSQNSQNVELDNYLDLPLRNGVSEKRSDVGKRTLNGVSYDSIADNVKPSNVFKNVVELSELEDEGEYEKEEFIGVPGISSENLNGYFEDVKQPYKNKQDAERIAIGALAKRAFTVRELRKKMHAKRVPPNIIDEVLTDFQNRGLLNDYLYAEAFCRSRWSSSTWGPGRIKQALHQKGVSAADAEKAMKHVFEDDDSGDGEESNLGMSKISVDQLFVQASKQWLRGQNVPLDKRKSRMIMWLQYRGFNWGVTSTILKKLESQYPPRR